MAAEPIAEHIVVCAHCHSDNVIGQGTPWYGYCRCCGSHFWDRPS